MTEQIRGNIITSFKWFNQLGLIALLFALSSTIGRWSANQQIGLLSFSLPASYSYLGFGLLSVAHFFVMHNAISDCARAWQQLDKASRLSIYGVLVASAGIMTKGVERFSIETKNDDEKVVLEGELEVPVTWVFLALSALVVASTVNVSLAITNLGKIGLTTLIIMVNWSMASACLTAYRDLGTNEQYSRYFRDGFGPRYIPSSMSRVFPAKNVTFEKYSKVILKDSFCNAAMLTLLIGMLFGIVNFGGLAISYLTSILSH
ncbi:MAG: hypothetical protein AAF337_09850 [Pseudomonadota bacterium]